MAETSLFAGLDKFQPIGISQPVDTVSVLEDQASELQAAISNGEVATHANGPTYGGMLGDEGIGDFIAVDLTAGETYTWSYRGTEVGGIEDPFLVLYDEIGNFVTLDDDGGNGRTSQITYTAPTTGTYFLLATSWYQAAGEAFEDVGDYTITQWSPDPAHDAPDDFSTTFSLSLGTNYAYVDAPGDVDFYTFDVTAGQLYSFEYSGGVSGGADRDGEPGENIGIIYLLDEGGNVIASNLNFESSVSFFADEDATLFVVTEPFEGTGGYTLDVRELDPAAFDPLESLNWDNASNIPTVDVDGVPTAYVYFGEAGENFGELGDDGGPMITYGWQQYQIDAIMDSINTHYSPITGIDYVITDNAEEATFRLMTTESQQYGAYFYPQDPAFGDAQGIGVFNLLSGGFGSVPESLDPGGFSWAVVLHEFGHAHGVAHPHDTGGGSEIMLGVSAATGSLGIYDLNQGVYTVMSYNDAWVTHPDGERGLSLATIGDGWSESLGAFDIAVLQARYGVHANNDGDTVYELTDVQEEASYNTIWDTSGTDSIVYNGDVDVRIDLLAATLDYTPTGGGVVSFVNGIYGGYTIANGVVIENATGGAGNDVLIGNDAANILTGNQGDDMLMGRAGDDTLNGGNGNDELYGDEGNDTLNGGNGVDLLEGGDDDDTLNGGNGDDTLNGGAGSDTLTGGKGADHFVFDAIGDGVDTVTDYDYRKDSLFIDTEGLVQWQNSGGDALLYVDGEVAAIFEGQSAMNMIGEWSGSEAFGLMA